MNVDNNAIAMHTRASYERTIDFSNGLDPTALTDQDEHIIDEWLAELVARDSANQQTMIVNNLSRALHRFMMIDEDVLQSGLSRAYAAPAINTKILRDYEESSLR